MTAERGAIHLTLVALLFGGVLTMGLAVDIARLGASWREATHVAATAAEVGAGWIDRSEARDGDLKIATGKAQDAALAIISDSGHQGEIEATRRRVCVTVRIKVRPTLLTIVGAGPKIVTSTACAEPRKG